MIKRFPKNELGHDYYVGDIHGCFSLLSQRLQEIGFNAETDRLFSVGDLVDRGKESELSIEWLSKPWFHAVMGNHEAMAIDYHNSGLDEYLYMRNGGSWFIGMTKEERSQYADAFSHLPIAIEVETDGGLIGVIHAECPVNDWRDLPAALYGHNGDAFKEMCIWSRERITSGNSSIVNGVRSVIVGHTPMPDPSSLGNVVYIDTGAVFGKALTILKDDGGELRVMD